jgi:hypothetical protein
VGFLDDDEHAPAALGLGDGEGLGGLGDQGGAVAVRGAAEKRR